MEIGGDLEITLFDKDAAKNRIRCIGCQKFKIVGSFPDADQKSAEKIICPLNCLRGIFERNQMDLYRSHATVILENPLKLNAFKGYAKEVGFTEIQPTEKESIYGNSIIMYDKTFMDAATPIRHNILLGEKMFPIFLFLIMMIGVLISVLSIHNRKSEIFIYRLLGVRGKEVVAAIVREIGFLCICGLTGNMAVSRAILLMEGKMILAVSGLYFICYLLGSIVTTSIYTHRNLLND